MNQVSDEVWRDVFHVDNSVWKSFENCRSNFPHARGVWGHDNSASPSTSNQARVLCQSFASKQRPVTYSCLRSWNDVVCGLPVHAKCAKRPTPDRGNFSQFSFSECLIIICEQKSKIASRFLIFVFGKNWKLEKWTYNFKYLGSAKTEKQWIFNFRLEWKSKIEQSKNQILIFLISWKSNGRNIHGPSTITWQVN